MSTSAQVNIPLGPAAGYRPTQCIVPERARTRACRSLRPVCIAGAPAPTACVADLPEVFAAFHHGPVSRQADVLEHSLVEGVQFTPVAAALAPRLDAGEQAHEQGRQRATQAAAGGGWKRTALTWPSSRRPVHGWPRAWPGRARARYGLGPDKHALPCREDAAIHGNASARLAQRSAGSRRVSRAASRRAARSAWPMADCLRWLALRQNSPIASLRRACASA